MQNFQTDSLDLAKTQREVIDTLLRTEQQAGLIKSPAEYEAERKGLTATMEPKSPLMKVRPQSERALVTPYNRTYRETYLDLQTVFAHLGKVDAAMKKHQRLNQSVAQNIELGIKKAKDELAKLERLIVTGASAVVETFRDANSFESRQALYTERNGTVLPFDTRARLDLLQEGLKLPVIFTENALISSSGVRRARIWVKKQLAGGHVRITNPETDLDKSIDTSLETFWSETILTDEPIRVDLGPAYYGVRHGAVCELEVEFDAATPINELSFIPFSEYPLDVVAIKGYTTSDNADEVPVEIVAPGKEANRLGSVSSRDPIVYQFPDVVVKRLVILLNQRHYVRSELIVSQQAKGRLEMLFGAANAENPGDILPDDMVFRPIAVTRAEENPAWAIFQKVMRDKEFDIDTLDRAEPDTTRPVAKVAYNYGLHDVGVKKREYHNTGVYVSRPIAVPGNVHTVRLTTTEVHPSLESPDLADSRVTAVEYYVADEQVRKGWHPILPEGQKQVLGELLQVDFIHGAFRGALRFPAGRILAVRKEGRRMIDGEYQIEGREVILPTYDPGASYTVDYEPTEDAHAVDFVKQLTPQVAEYEFGGTPIDGVITLPVYPFLDLMKMNQQPESWNPSVLSEFAPVKVSLVFPDGRRLEQPTTTQEEARVQNRTNYFHPTLSFLDPFDPTLGNYQYLLHGNTLRLNTPLGKDVKVIVEFPYLMGALRLKIILRRTLDRLQGLTPVVLDYALRLQTIR